MLRKTILTAAALTAISVFTLGSLAKAEGRPHGCPHAWCGCWLSQHVFGQNRRDLWKATAWLKFPRTHKRPGAIAVMRHHVGIVKAIDSHGNPVILSGNHNRRVGTGTYPVRRIIAFVSPNG